MIHYKSPQEILVMKKSCKMAAEVLEFIEPHVKPGVCTLELNDLCHKFILDKAAYPSPLGYKGFPKSICTSVNSVVCHGIPDKYILREGDIVNLDITTFFEGYHGDTSKTFLVGKCSRAARDLVSTAETAMWKGIEVIRPGAHVGDIGAAIQEYVEPLGYSIVREYTGHGIGANFHEDPFVSHVGKKNSGTLIKAGMVFTVEPMINLGTNEIELLEDGWTVVTADNKLSAQFEHTIAVFEDRVEVLTLRKECQKDPVIWHR